MEITDGILEKNINTEKITRVTIVIIALFCLLPVILNICCVTPIYFKLENDTLYQGSAITVTLKYIADLLDVLSFSSAYATVIFFLILKNVTKKKTTALAVALYVAILILKIPARMLMNIPLLGSIGTKAEIIADLLKLGFFLLLELLQFLFVFIFAYTTAKSYNRSIDIVYSKKSSAENKPDTVLPIKKFVNWYNPLLRSAVYMSLTVIIFRVFSRLVTDIDAGAPNSFGEVMIIIVSYLSDAIYGLAAYIIAILIFNLLYERLTKSAPAGNGNTRKKSDEKSATLNTDNDGSQSSLFEDD